MITMITTLMTVMTMMTTMRVIAIFLDASRTRFTRLRALMMTIRKILKCDCIERIKNMEHLKMTHNQNYKLVLFQMHDGSHISVEAHSTTYHNLPIATKLL